MDVAKAHLVYDFYILGGHHIWLKMRLAVFRKLLSDWLKFVTEYYICFMIAWHIFASTVNIAFLVSLNMFNMFNIYATCQSD